MITFEGTGPFGDAEALDEAVQGSAGPGQITGNVAIGGIVGLLGVLPAIALIAGGGYWWVSQDGAGGLDRGRRR